MDSLDVSARRWFVSSAALTAAVAGLYIICAGCSRAPATITPGPPNPAEVPGQSSAAPLIRVQDSAGAGGSGSRPAEGRAAAHRLATARAGSAGVPAHLPAVMPAGPAVAPAPVVLSGSAGAGVVVCAPAPAASDAELATFGRGCARWLDFAVGSQGELGGNPLWRDMDRAAHELDRPAFDLSAHDAGGLRRVLGVSCAATGVISGSMRSCTLNYQLESTSTCKPIGVPVAVSGTPDQIVAALPRVAAGIAARAGARHPRIPDAVGADVSALILVGRLPITAQEPFTDADAAALRSLAQTFPVAGMLLVANHYTADDQETADLGARLARQCPDSPLALAEVAGISSPPPAWISAVRRVARRYSQSYLAALAEVWMRRATREPDAEFAAAQRAVRAAPANPLAWLTLGYSYSSRADAVRAGRYWGAMTPAEQAQVERSYPLWQHSVARAAALDPLCGRAWDRLALAATFNGDRSTADLAFWKALDLYDDKADVLMWGMQMFAPKWNDEADALARVAHLASTTDWPHASAVVNIAQDLKGDHFDKEAASLLQRSTERFTSAVHDRPDSAQAHYDLAAVMGCTGDLVGAAREYKEVLRLRPNDAPAFGDLAWVCEQRRRYGEGIRLRRKQVALEPASADNHYYLGWDLKETGAATDAVREFRQALALNPRLVGPHNGLGLMAMAAHDSDTAIAEFKAELKIAPHEKLVLLRLAQLLAMRGSYDEAIQLATRAARDEPTDAQPHDALGYIYGSKKDPQRSAEECQTAIRLDPNDMMAHENLGDALSDMGRKDAAKAEWQLVLRSGAPAASEARQMLAKFR